MNAVWTFVRRAALPRIGTILLAWVALLAVEHVAVGFGYRALFVGTWEMGAARTFVSPITLAMLLPGAVLAYLFAELARNGVREEAARVACAIFAALGSAAVAIGVSGGRHMESLAVRAPFVALLSLLGATAAYVAAPRLVGFAARSPRAFAAIGAVGAGLFWAADSFVLPRLYPAFHLGLFVLTLAAAAFAARPIWNFRRTGTVVLVFSVACALVTPWAAQRLATVDNLRVVLLEHAPLMGRAVMLAAAIAPPADDLAEGEGLTSLDSVTSAKVIPGQTGQTGQVPRALDWTGRDIVLISVDALRADHVGAYGYKRPTTPNIDKLAAEGTLFESAYCPTPHTSYSITSMMTGKYMRPLLLVGLGEDSETWAKLMRQYGHLTAAFYPPAVFFIDASRFTTFEKSGLDFEYRRVEFSSADERAEQVGRYLDRGAQPSRPLFLWVHLFEPHEPYVMHPEHLFGAPDAPTDRDRYDSEVAAADAGIGKILARVREKRPHAVVMLTADHGEEFGEHGGRYHGTTVYDEQVRVPLIVAGGGAPKRVSSVVQTIDLLPTTLSALGIPRPARLRGRDLGSLIADRPSQEAPAGGLAFVETDHFTLLARGQDRLVCARKAGACTLYDAKSDPHEEHDVGGARPDTVKELRQLTAAIAREHGRLERGDAQAWPEALRRGSQGDVEAAPDVAMLLDDVRLDVRRKAADVLFDLRAPATAAALQRALATAEDPQVRAGCALALVRLGEAPSRAAEDALKSPLEWKRRAALAFAERGDARGLADLLAWWNESRGEREMNLDFERAKELLVAFAKLRDPSAVSPLVRTLGDVRLRPFIADALATIGEPSARPSLLAAFATERYVPTRPHLARALLALGATREEMRAPLLRFAGLPEPMPEAMTFALDAKVLDEVHGGWVAPVAKGGAPTAEVAVTLPTPRQKRPAPLRLLVLLEKEGDTVQGTAEARPVSSASGEGALRVVELGPEALELPRIHLQLAAPGGIRALWLLPHTEEIEPPPPEPWDAGSVDPADSGQ
ncbi:sulfatase-like hydrolase/transferase [Pendulispora rubella]|uniref:Sulfatase-like hydrolase/transferase n=1 Tax=Pendulispora rubella TaxID=2741070 RepID=A0ABZ2LIX3_9BACT